MTSLSLREAAEQAGTSKSTIWRAIKGGRLSATRTDDGGFAIDPAELFRAFPTERTSERAAGQDATPHEIASERPATRGTDRRTDELAVKLAASAAELTGLKALLAEVKANRDEQSKAVLSTARRRRQRSLALN
jgi:excisionase family DNA binding protein